MESHQTLTILGLGSAGAATAARLQKLLPSETGIRLVAVDTDRKKLSAAGLPPENTLLAAPDWLNGRGCGGDVLAGQRALAYERKKIESLIGEPEFLLVVASLGGGTATGGAGIVQSICRKNHIPVIYLVTLPFTQEGHSRRQAAEDAIRQDLQSTADAVLALPNDLLYSVLPPTTPIAEACEEANNLFAETAAALTLMLTQNNLLSPDAADLAALLRRRKSFCSIGVGRASASDGASRSLTALENMLLSPLLGGAAKISQADAVIFSMIGSSSLAIGEVRQTLDTALEYTSPGAKILSGASVDPAFGDKVMLCCITVKFEEASEETLPGFVRKEEAHPAPKTVKPRSSKVKKHGNGDADQQLFPFENRTKGMMEKTAPFMWNGEDLDYPTWQRRSVTIDQGEIVSL